MKTCTVMQRLVTRLLEQHDVDLAYPEAYLKLEVPSFMPLVVERIGPARLSIAHYYVHDDWSGELVADPDVEIFTGYDLWVPLAIQHPPPFGYMVTATLTSDGRSIERLNRKAQKDLATFVNQWARNLKVQGFLDRATVAGKKTWPTPPPGPPRAAPDPTTTLPDEAATKSGDLVQLALW